MRKKSFAQRSAFVRKRASQRRKKNAGAREIFRSSWLSKLYPEQIKIKATAERTRAGHPRQELPISVERAREW
jgi:hypothetical protein